MLKKQKNNEIPWWTTKKNNYYEYLEEYTTKNWQKFDLKKKKMKYLDEGAGHIGKCAGACHN